MKNRATRRGIGGLFAEVLAFTLVLGVVGTTTRAQETPPADDPHHSEKHKAKPISAAIAPLGFDCGYHPPEWWLRELQEAVRRGEIPYPATKRLPVVAPRIQRQGGPACVPTPNTTDLFPFEDSAGLLLTNFSNGALGALMTDAANALLAAEGDNFDFVAFWVNFTPHHTVSGGSAFYRGLENDVSGIGRGFLTSGRRLVWLVTTSRATS